MNLIKESIIKTLCYADVFDYPLTLDEIWKYLISKKRVSKEELKREIKSLNSKIKKKDKFYFLSGGSEIIKNRKLKEKESREKNKKLKKIIPSLFIVPTVQFIGVSGALAMENADKYDDIDLFVITKKNTLWITRLILIIILQIFGKRRKRLEKNPRDKICLNFLIDETELNFSKRNDLYNAHEICQMKPVFNKNNTYEKFMDTNKWLGKFLPNAVKYGNKQNNTQIYSESIFSFVLRLVLRFSALEIFAKKLQLWYMKKHRTREIISDSILAFHPVDYKTRIMNVYKAKLKKYEKI